MKLSLFKLGNSFSYIYTVLAKDAVYKGISHLAVRYPPYGPTGWKETLKTKSFYTDFALSFEWRKKKN